MVEPSIIIRRASPGDAEKIAFLYTQLVEDVEVNVIPDRIIAMSQDTNCELFVCEFQHEVRGTVLVSLCADAMYGFQPFAVLENLVVDNSTRRRGIGSSLLRHAENFCVEKDCSKIMLLSSASRTDAHEFWEKFGFRGSTKKGFVKYRRDFIADA